MNRASAWSPVHILRRRNYKRMADEFELDYEGEEHHHHHRSSAETQHRERTESTGGKKKEYYYDSHGRQHTRVFKHRSSVRSEYNERRHESGRRDRISAKKVILTILISIGVIAVLLFSGWKILDVMGKNALYGSADSKAPTLAEVETEEQVIPEEDEIRTEYWESGWIRYKGEVYEYNEDILTFLMMGIDKKTEKVAPAKDGISGGQADGLFLLILNPHTHKMQLLAINRNTMTEIDVYNEAGEFVGSGLGQICLQHGYGDGMEVSCRRTVKAVSNLFYSLPIHGYASINMGVIPLLNDAIGGVTVPRMTHENDEIVYGDLQTLYGNDALRYVTNRGNEYEAARFRLEKQKEYLKSFVSKLREQVIAHPATAVELYNIATPYMVTDITLSEVTYLAGQAGDYSFDFSGIYSMKGTTISEEEAKTGHEEFIYDEEQLYDLMIQLFYEKVDEDRLNN